MKRQEIHEKQKLKKFKNLRWLTWAKNVCIIMVILFLVYVSLLSIQYKEGFSQLLSDNLFVIIGFIVCTMNILVFYDMRNIIAHIEDYTDIDTNRLKLVVYGVGQLFMFNYASAILIFLSLYKYFRWDMGIKVIFSEVKKAQGFKNVVASLVVVIFFLALTYFISFVALTK